jgi:acyl-CoA hydrolase
MQELSATDAAGLLRTRDTLAIPLGPGQPPAFMRALSQRSDWEELRVGGALLLVDPSVFFHPNVHYLSGFWGPIERALRDQGANIGFAPADFRRFGVLLKRDPPRVMATAATPPDADGFVSLSLHAGGTLPEMQAVGADPDRLLVVECSEKYPRTRGLLPDHPHRLHVDEIDVLIRSDDGPLPLPAMPASDIEAKIAEHATRFVVDGATLQTGIGGIPTAIARSLATGRGGGYGVHTEMFTDGLMDLHKAGKIDNGHKGQFEGLSVATFAAGTQELYDWLDGNEEVAFLPVEVINSPEVIGRNHEMLTINGALAVDIHGQVVADTIDGTQFSGVGGQEDFIAGPGLSISQRSLLCLPATATVGGKLVSRIVPFFGPGAVISTPRHQVDVIVTEYGAAELEGRTVHQRGLALAEIAHPDFRDELREAAERASKGHTAVG